MTDDLPDEIDTVTVTEELTPQGLDAMRVLLEMPEITPVMLAQLARDVAQDFSSLPTILSKHRLTTAQYEFLSEHNEFYKHILTDQIKAWQGVGGTEARVKMQSLLAYEELLPTIAGRMGRHTEELKDVIEGAKMLAKVSGIDTSERNRSAPGERFQIHIDLGADTKAITIEATPSPPLIDVTPEKVKAP
jgi:hypothetical protein